MLINRALLLQVLKNEVKIFSTMPQLKHRESHRLCDGNFKLVTSIKLCKRNGYVA